MANFGYAQVIAVSQSNLQPARSAFLAGSACVVQASFFDTTDAPLTPSMVTYTLLDVLSGEVLVTPTTVTPATVVSIPVTAAQNAMISLTRQHEAKRMVLTMTDVTGASYEAEVEYDITATVPPIEMGIP